MSTAELVKPIEISRRKIVSVEARRVGIPSLNAGGSRTRLAAAAAGSVPTSLARAGFRTIRLGRWRGEYSSPPSCTVVGLAKTTTSATKRFVFSLHKHAVHPRPLGNVAVRKIHRALTVGLVIDGVDLASIRPRLAHLWICEGHAQHHDPLHWRRRLLGGMMVRRLLMIQRNIAPPELLLLLIPHARLARYRIPVHRAVLGSRSRRLARYTMRHWIMGALDPFAPHLRNGIIRAPMTSLFITLLLFLLLLPNRTSVTISTILLGANLVPHPSHLIETALRTVAYYCFPTAK